MKGSLELKLPFDTVKTVRRETNQNLSSGLEMQFFTSVEHQLFTKLMFTTGTKCPPIKQENPIYLQGELAMGCLS